MDFNSLNQKTNQYGETNDCTVKAMTIILGSSYEYAHKVAESFGRVRRKGMKASTYKKALESQGVQFTHLFTRDRIIKPNGRAGYGKPTIMHNQWYQLISLKTVRELPYFLPKQGTFMVRTSHHVLAYKDGKVIDHTEGGRHRIVDVWYCDVSNVDINDEGVTITRIAPVASNPSTGRTRQSRVCWKLIRLDTGETLSTYRRKPTEQIRRIRNGGFIPSLGKNVKIAIVPV